MKPNIIKEVDAEIKYYQEAYKEGLNKGKQDSEDEKRELIGMLESINTIMWESGMIKGKEVDKVAIMEVLERFSGKY